MTERTKGPAGMDSIRHYVEMRDRMPLSSLGDSVHSIHASTEFEADLTLTDLKEACSAYNDLIAALDYIQMHSNEKAIREKAASALSQTGASDEL